VELIGSCSSFANRLGATRYQNQPRTNNQREEVKSEAGRTGTWPTSTPVVLAVGGSSLGCCHPSGNPMRSLGSWVATIVVTLVAQSKMCLGSEFASREVGLHQA